MKKTVKSQKLWKRAKQIIPGGNSLLSKRPEMFLPDFWPAYFKSTDGCRVTDIDDNKFIDMSLMGVGTNILGYNNIEVDNAVSNVIKDGNLSTLNCTEEVFLAEKLIEMHPWFDMVRFARTGGEANAIAIRIARAFSSKDNVAVCGYHGWHDWYLSANLTDQKNLDSHLLPGLSPDGVPKNLKGTVFTFKYNDINSFSEIVDKNNIGVVKMEVSRSNEPNTQFLQEIREICNKHSIVLIFDECTSGFRSAYGGIHINTGIKPDMAIFGKALGNGYPITAILGKGDIMQSAQSSFISSTFWTERIGYAAALATLKEMKKISSWKIISETGNLIRQEWTRMSQKYNLRFDVSGISALPTMTFDSDEGLLFKTLISQEMLKRGYLASNSVYCCTQHTSGILKDYFEALEQVFILITNCKSKEDIISLLDGPICHTGFRRLN